MDHPLSRSKSQVTETAYITSYLSSAFDMELRWGIRIVMIDQRQASVSFVRYGQNINCKRGSMVLFLFRVSLFDLLFF
jgi:hypothetical protein